MSRTKRFFIVVIATFFCGLIMFGSMYSIATRAVETEWSLKVQPRRMDVRWGIVETLVDCMNAHTPQCTSVPNFIPQSMWDNEACAALVRNTLNFTIGEDVFENAPAWLFARKNADRMTLVYDRSDDFHIDRDAVKVVEDRDDGFRLSKLLSPDHLYVLGYHYHQTRSDPKILAADAYINSHLMLLLPRTNRRWWGFHLVHFGQDSPIRIDPIGFMPKHFDLVYIWRVDDVFKPQRAAQVELAHNTLSYEQSRKWLRFGRWGGSISSYIDSVMMWMANHYYGTRQFPSVVIRRMGDSTSHTQNIKQTVVAEVRVQRGDKLSELVATHPDATVFATCACNPELKSKHRIYVSQVLRLCK